MAYERDHEVVQRLRPEPMTAIEAIIFPSTQDFLRQLKRPHNPQLMIPSLKFSSTKCI